MVVVGAMDFMPEVVHVRLCAPLVYQNHRHVR